MSEHYEIVLFTASTQPYAEAIVQSLDPEGLTINYILHRAHCFETRNGYAIKDLRIIKNRDLKNILIVDNLVHSFGLQISNGIPILEWEGNEHDTELKHLAEYLLEAKDADNLADFNSKRLKLKEFAAIPNFESWINGF